MVIYLNQEHGGVDRLTSFVEAHRVLCEAGDGFKAELEREEKVWVFRIKENDGSRYQKVQKVWSCSSKAIEGSVASEWSAAALGEELLLFPRDGAWVETDLLVPLEGHVLEPTRLVRTSGELTEVLPAVLRREKKAYPRLNRLVTILCCDRRPIPAICNLTTGGGCKVKQNVSTREDQHSWSSCFSSFF